MNPDVGQRLNIAIDVASALEYLHHHFHTPIVHCDLKSSNILLDTDMKAFVSDFGLARYLSKPTAEASKNSNSSIEMKETIGYVAPEYDMGAQESASGDVYSCGILLLEMVTGKAPTNEFTRVKMAIPHLFMDTIAPCLLSYVEDYMGLGDVRKKIQECVVSVVRIGLSSSQESPRDRMEMRKKCPGNCMLSRMHL